MFFKRLYFLCNLNVFVCMYLCVHDILIHLLDHLQNWLSVAPVVLILL